MKSARAILAVIVAVSFAGPALSQPASSSPDDLLNKARAAYNNRDFEKAAAAYGEFARLYPTDQASDEAGFFEGHSLYLIRHYDEADKVFAREENNNAAYEDQILFYRGEIAMLRRDYNNALIFYDRLLAETPDSMMAGKAENRRAEVYYLLGNRYLAKNALSLALQHYRQAAETPPDIAPLVKFKLGLVHKKMSEFDEAAAVWSGLADDNSEEAMQASRLARYSLARLKEDQGALDQAEAEFRKLIDAAPDGFLAPLAREGLARVWARQGKTEEAMAYWSGEGISSSLIALSGEFSSAIGHFLHEEFADAEKALISVMSQTADEEMMRSARVWLARTYVKMGRRAEARTAYAEVVSTYDLLEDEIKIEYAEFLLGSDPAEAARAAGKVKEENRGSDAAQAVLILSLASTNPSEFISSAETFLERRPGAVQAGEIALRKGRLLHAQGELSRAEKDFALAARVHPDPEKRIEAAAARAEIFRSEGRLDSAAEVLDNAKADARLTLSPEEKLAASQAEIEYARGEYEKGLATYAAICDHRAVCPDQVKLRLFWGYYRSGAFDKMNSVLDELLYSPDEKTKFLAGLWRGIVLIEQDRGSEALSYLENLRPVSGLGRGIMLLQMGRAQTSITAWEDAIKTLRDIDSRAPAAALCVKGLILDLALKSGDFNVYLEAQPRPAAMDEAYISEASLLYRIRMMSREDAPSVEKIEELLNALKVVAVSEDSIDEADFRLAEAKLVGPRRQEGLDLMSGILARTPDSPYAPLIKLYQGEETFARKDYKGALSWTTDVKPEDLPADRRFRLLYLKAQSHKNLREMDKARPYYLALINNYSDYKPKGREWLDVGVGLTLTQEYNAAQAALDLALAGSADHKQQAEAMYWKGMSQQGAGDLDGALATFLSISERYPSAGMWTATALYEAAQIYAAKGDYDKALATYDRVLALTKGDKRTQDQVKAKIAEVKKLKSLEERDRIIPGAKP